MLFRDMPVNTIPVWHSEYLGTDFTVDSNGDYTGEKENRYTEPVRRRLNLSPAHGNVVHDVFGSNINYSRVITTTRMNLGITENSLIWDVEPSKKSDGTTDFSKAKYRVVRVAKGRYHMRYALRNLLDSGDGD